MDLLEESLLKILGHNSFVYVDDSYFERETYQTCLDNISDTIIEGTGLCYSNRKIGVSPSETIVFLCFIISSKIWCCYQLMKRIIQKKFDGKIKLSAKVKAEIQWWINNIDNTCHHINISNTDILIKVLTVGYHWWYILIQGTLA